MGQTQRFGGFGLCRALVDSPCDGVAGVAITPVCLGFLTACRLAVGISAGALSASHSRIGPEPPATDGARSLPGLGHRDDLSSSSPSDRGEAGGQFRISGSFLVSRGGSFLESAEGRRALRQFTNSDDVGAPPIKGAAEYDPATKQYKITGSGTDIWGKADQFHCVWREISGDFTVTATARSRHVADDRRSC